MLKFKGKIDDFVVAGALGGLIATIPMDLLNLISWRLKIASTTNASFNSSIVAQKWQAERPKALTFGEIYHFIFEAIAGIPLSAMLKISGTKYHLLKGAGMGAFIWAIPLQMVTRRKYFRLRPTSFRGHYAALLERVVWGICTAHMIVHLANPKVFPKEVLARTER